MCWTARVTVLCAKGGVEPQSETVWRQADNYHVPRMVYVNKMDIMGADFYNVLRDDARPPEVQRVCPFSCPSAPRAIFKGIIDLVEMNADVYYDDLGKDMRVEDIPEDMMDLAQEYRDEAGGRCCRSGRRDHDACISRARKFPLTMIQCRSA